MSGRQPILDLASLRCAPLHRNPFEWSWTADVFTPAHASLLAEEFPETGFRETTSEPGAPKMYRFWNLDLVLTGIPQPALRTLSPAWQQLVAELLTTEYREAVATVFDMDLRSATLEIRCCRYGRRCSLGPHTDRADKMVTQVMYFNRAWKPIWGGAVVLLRSNDLASAAMRLRPDIGSSVLIRRSEQSWHAVEPIMGGAPDRCSLLIHIGTG